jgi:hypothetical protein
MHRQNCQSTKKPDAYAQEEAVMLHYFLAFSTRSTTRRMVQLASIDNQSPPELAKRLRTIPRWIGYGSRTHG